MKGGSTPPPQPTPCSPQEKPPQGSRSSRKRLTGIPESLPASASGAKGRGRQFIARDTIHCSRATHGEPSGRGTALPKAPRPPGTPHSSPSKINDIPTAPTSARSSRGNRSLHRRGRGSDAGESTAESESSPRAMGVPPGDGGDAESGRSEGWVPGTTRPPGWVLGKSSGVWGDASPGAGSAYVRGGRGRPNARAVRVSLSPASMSAASSTSLMIGWTEGSGPIWMCAERTGARPKIAMIASAARVACAVGLSGGGMVRPKRSGTRRVAAVSMRVCAEPGKLLASNARAWARCARS